MGRKEDKFEPALLGKKIPILTLDNKWHRLFTQYEPTPVIENLAQKLNDLLKRQGKLTSDAKQIRKLKKKLVDEIVALRDESLQANPDAIERKIEENKKLLEDCNKKISAYKDELAELPEEIDRVNYKLMMATMEVCYDRIQSGTKEIQQISEWVAEVRVELKEKLVRKQEMETVNHELYSYMHDIFGADVIEIFDMKYNPEEHKPKPTGKKS